MRILLRAGLCCGLAFSAMGATPEELTQKYSRDGKLLFVQLASAPFPHPSRAEGHKYKEEFFSAKDHYLDNTVGIFVPKGFHAGRAVDFIVHFHGWRNTVPGTLERYQLIEQLVASGRNAVLVVPEGPRDAADSAGGRLEDAGAFKVFITDVEKALRERAAIEGKDWKVGSIILSGHSGGYNVMSAIVERGGLSERIREVWLFDALYAQTERFRHWFDTQHGRLVDIYTEHGGTKKETEELLKSLREAKATVLAGKESELPMNNLPGSGAIFIYTELEHNDVLDKHRTFEQFLKSSCLKPI